MNSTSFFFITLTLFLYTFAGYTSATYVTFYITNKCPFPIWPATAANIGNPVISQGGFSLPPGQTKRIIAPYKWSGRIWARTGCDFTTSSKPGCETGDCEGKLACEGSIGLPPVTLVQVSVKSDKTKPSFYDVSLVDGYNLPVSVVPRLKDTGSTIKGCVKNLKDICPRELRVVNDQGKVVACKSACLAFNQDVFCCRNSYGSPEKCKASLYSRMFKDACPDYYSYAFDTKANLVSCDSDEYVVTFCPSKWGEYSSI